jgi:hypothetical protein
LALVEVGADQGSPLDQRAKHRRNLGSGMQEVLTVILGSLDFESDRCLFCLCLNVRFFHWLSWNRLEQPV